MKYHISWWQASYTVTKLQRVRYQVQGRLSTFFAA